MKQTLFRLIFMTVAAALMTAIMPGCSRGAQDRPVVTVSIPPQKYFLEQIAGDKLNVRCLLAHGGNPENYEPSIADMRDLQESILYLTAGNLPFETSLVSRIAEINPGLDIVDTSAGISLIAGTHSHGDSPQHEHDDTFDPHTWTSVKNARVIAANITDALVRTDPANADYYRSRHRRFDTRLDSIDRAFASRLEPFKGERFLVWHPSLSYLARDYGLEQIAVGSSTKELSVADLRRSIDNGRDGKVAVFFYQPDMDGRQARVLNAQIGAREVDVNSLDGDWEGTMNKIVDALSSK